MVKWYGESLSNKKVRDLNGKINGIVGNLTKTKHILTDLKTIVNTKTGKNHFQSLINKIDAIYNSIENDRDLLNKRWLNR